MSTKRSERTQFQLDPLFADEQPHVRRCDHPGCAAAGEYRAPKAPERLRDYYWFCIDHVRAYNASWNFCASLGDEDVERMIRQDTCWQRPTWPFGSWQAAENRLHARARAEYEAAGDRRANGGAKTGGQHKAGRPRTEADRALDVLDLTPPVDLAAIKARYKALVKRYHPDANGGSRDAEERLKSINWAYTTLRNAYAA